MNEANATPHAELIAELMNPNIPKNEREHAAVREIERLCEALAQPAQEPVAMRYDYDGYGYKYIDSGSGSDWQTRIKDAEPIYTTPPAAQPAQEGLLHIDRLDKWLDASLKERAQPAQEPVANQCKGIPRKGCNYLTACDRVCNKCGEIHHHHQMVANFTFPPQRPWVELTDEEIQELRYKIDSTAHWTYDEFARYIEAKLKEKNT